MFHTLCRNCCERFRAWRGSAQNSWWSGKQGGVGGCVVRCGMHARQHDETVMVSPLSCSAITPKRAELEPWSGALLPKCLTSRRQNYETEQAQMGLSSSLLQTR